MAATACVAGRTATPAPPAVNPAQGRANIERSIPANVPDREGWVTDVYAGFTVQNIELSRQNVCAVVAVIEQESGFRVDPVIPGLPAIARREIDNRTERAGVPRLIVHAALQLKSTDGRTYGERIDAARTEKDLSDTFEDFINAVPLGHTLFADHNPVRTRGPMQVNIAFAEAHARVEPYPYPVRLSIADEVFSRRGSLYFGIAHLLGYSPHYDRYLYRFADFNAGQYASRNAAFQRAAGMASGIPLKADGALLAHDSGAAVAGDTELALRALDRRLEMRDAAIHSALEQGNTKDFEDTPLYQRVYALAERKAGRQLPRASVPQIELHGAKLTRPLTTEWYARRVNQRFDRCVNK